jgi:hypothetical protein
MIVGADEVWRDVPKACMTSGIESKAGCAGEGFESCVALPFTPFVPWAGSPFWSSAGMVLGMTLVQLLPPGIAFS